MQGSEEHYVACLAAASEEDRNEYLRLRRIPMYGQTDAEYSNERRLEYKIFGYSNQDKKSNNK